MARQDAVKHFSLGVARFSYRVLSQLCAQSCETAYNHMYPKGPLLLLQQAWHQTHTAGKKEKKCKVYATQASQCGPV